MSQEEQQDDLMRYDLLTQAALRSVVRLALLRVMRTGLPGGHHFFISFDTTHPGARLSQRLRARYESEMTIVLQHQFWNLHVFDDRFQIELSFDNIPEKLTIPFEAIKGFYDPSVQFGLQFAMATPEEMELLVGPRTPAPGEDGQPGSETAEPAAKNASGDEAAGDAPAGDAAKVVSLDTFRKK